ncbi:MAG: uridine diphosphate-N-acetylglucosamine-binding protein YvcK [Candidatus Paceibacterota bacterium]
MSPSTASSIRIPDGAKKIVTIGGGTGSYTMLTGLKEFPLEITAVVNMFDSGGSAGILRDEFGVLPPGDVRRCLLALSEGEQASILRDLFTYRFNGGTGLNGHSFGNLFLLALSSIYGGEIEGIRKASELLNLKGVVLPVSLDNSHIHAKLEDGTEIIGETNIDIPKHDGKLKITDVFLDPPAKLFDETRDAIVAADSIVVCPGDLYSSLVPTFLVEGMSDALKESKAKKILVSNLMTKWGETNGFVASDAARELLRFSGLPKFDHAICNTGTMDPDLVRAYEKENKFPMLLDDRMKDYATEVVTGDFFSEADIARHDSKKIAEIISRL